MRWWHRPFSFITSLADANPRAGWASHQVAKSSTKPSSRNHERSILKYGGLSVSPCDVHIIGVWSDIGLGSAVTLADEKTSSISTEHRKQSSLDRAMGFVEPRHVNRQSDGPISWSPTWASTSQKSVDPGSCPSSPFGRSAASRVTLKSPPMITEIP